MKHLFALVLALAPLAAPARADIGPPRILIEPAPKLPRAVTRWAKNALAAMKDGDMARAKALCDARGWSENLVGGSGSTLESLFAQGARKRWHLVLASEDVYRFLPGRRGVIVRAVVTDNDSGKVLDELHLLFVATTSPDIGYVALGAGEDVAQVDALAERWLAGQPLAPPVKTDSPKPE